MNLFNRLPGFERARAGLEWALIRHLPLLATRAASAHAARLAETDAIAVSLG